MCCLSASAQKHSFALSKTDFLLDGNKVKITCTFRGREMMHTDIGDKIVQAMCNELEDISTAESPPKMMGRMLLVVLSPTGKKKKEVAVKPTSTESM